MKTSLYFDGSVFTMLVTLKNSVSVVHSFIPTLADLSSPACFINLLINVDFPAPLYFVLMCEVQVIVQVIV